MLNETFIQFHRLPNDLKRAVTTPQAMEKIDQLETTYGVSLAELIVQIMIKEVPIASLEQHLAQELQLDPAKAQQLGSELRTTILAPVLPFLQGAPQPIRPQPLAQPVSPAPSGPATAPAQAGTVRPAPSLASLRVPPAVQPRPTPPPPPPPKPMHIPEAIRRAAGQAMSTSSAPANEDEREIAKHREQLVRMESASPTAQVEERMNALLAKHAVTLADPILMKRLRGVLLSRLRDVRTSDELRELLVRSQKVGGLGFDEALAGRLADDADQEAEALHDRSRAGHLAEAQAPRPPIAPSAPVPQAMVPPVRPAQEATVQAPQPLVSRAEPPSPPPPIQRPSPQIPSPIPVATQSPRPFRRPLPPPNQRLVHDIRRPSRPVSPIDELAQLSPDDFRTLGSDLQDSSLKVLEKINLLAEESLEQRASGVKAWRSSPTYQLYLSMGRESMTGGRPIEEITSDRKRRNETYLTGAEFSAIADLNRQLSM